MYLKKQDRESLRKSIENYFVKNPNFKKSEIVKHFEKQGIARSTKYLDIKRMASHQGVQDKKRPGRPKKLTPNKLKSLKP